jgi:hypothetical protein
MGKRLNNEKFTTADNKVMRATCISKSGCHEIAENTYDCMNQTFSWANKLAWLSF